MQTTIILPIFVYLRKRTFNKTYYNENSYSTQD